MNKNLLSIIISIFLIFAGGALVFGYNSGALAQFWSYVSRPTIDTNGIILFYGDGCPHCEIVDNFIAENKIEEKVKFTRLEVFNNKSNAAILLQKSKNCGFKTEEVGVPFLAENDRCVVGDQDVIKFFQEKIK